MADVTATAVQREADDATHGSLIKLAAEVASRLLGFATTWLLLRGLEVPRLGVHVRGLAPADFGLFGELSVYALLLAELGELGLQALASRALVAGTFTLASFVRARLLTAALVAAVALVAVPLAPAVAALAGRSAPRAAAVDAPALAFLIAWFALSGWGEFLGVALRCRRARRLEAVLLVVLRGGALAFAAAALAFGSGLRGVALALALSPLPALAAGVPMLRRTPAPAAAPDRPPLAVLRASAPLAVHGGLLLLSPRVEFLVLSWMAADAGPLGMFYAALNVIWFLSMVPSAVAAGAMPALTREALRGEGSVRRRTAATLALLGAPAAVGLALVAGPLAALLLGPGRAVVEYGGIASPLRVMAAAVPAMFLNAVLSASLIAAGRASWLPRLTAARVAVAFALALALVPRFGAMGAACGLVGAEWLLLAWGRAACRHVSFGVPVASPLAWALAACLPMALAVSGVASSLVLAVVVGALTWLATLAAAFRLAPAAVSQLTGNLRYP